MAVIAAAPMAVSSTPLARTLSADTVWTNNIATNARPITPRERLAQHAVLFPDEALCESPGVGGGDDCVHGRVRTMGFQPVVKLVLTQPGASARRLIWRSGGRGSYLARRACGI